MSLDHLGLASLISLVSGCFVLNTQTFNRDIFILMYEIGGMHKSRSNDSMLCVCVAVSQFGLNNQTVLGC